MTADLLREMFRGILGQHCWAKLAAMRRDRQVGWKAVGYLDRQLGNQPSRQKRGQEGRKKDRQIN
jgi:hypothetical protein